VKHCETFAVTGQRVAVSEKVSHRYVLNSYCMRVDLVCVVEVAIHVHYVSALEDIGKSEGQFCSCCLWCLHREDSFFTIRLLEVMNLLTRLVSGM
jgi:hypothetical protein